MKLLYLALWLSGGALLALEICTCLSLLRLCALRQEAEAQATWDLLLRRESA